MRQLSSATGREEAAASAACGKRGALVAVVSKACYYAAALVIRGIAGLHFAAIELSVEAAS